MEKYEIIFKDTADGIYKMMDIYSEQAKTWIEILKIWITEEKIFY